MAALNVCTYEILKNAVITFNIVTIIDIFYRSLIFIEKEITRSKTLWRNKQLKKLHYKYCPVSTYDNIVTSDHPIWVVISTNKSPPPLLNVLFWKYHLRN